MANQIARSERKYNFFERALAHDRVERARTTTDLRDAWRSHWIRAYGLPAEVGLGMGIILSVLYFGS